VGFSELGFLGSTCAGVLVGLDGTILSQQEAIFFFFFFFFFGKRYSTQTTLNKSIQIFLFLIKIRNS
jgi:hypothetical protein